MYDTRLADVNLSLDSVIDRVPEYDIYSFYMGSSFKLGQVMSSPFRQDKHPSFGIFKSNKYGNLLYKDLATGSSGNCVQFVQQLFNISYRKALIKIISDLSNNNLNPSVQGISIKEEYKSIETIISIRKKNFCKIDDDYWDSYCLERDDLRHFNVFPIWNYWVNEIVQPWVYNEANPGYAYQIYNKYQIYKPLSPRKDRFRMNCTSYDLFGYEQLEYKGDLLIITKSGKDCMVLSKLGYNSVATLGEGKTIPVSIITDLKCRYNRILIFYDNDDSGKKGASNLKTKTAFSTIFIPDDTFGTKDISDYIKKYGKESTEELMKELIQIKI